MPEVEIVLMPPPMEREPAEARNTAAEEADPLELDTEPLIEIEPEEAIAIGAVPEPVADESEMLPFTTSGAMKERAGTEMESVAAEKEGKEVSAPAGSV